MPIKNNNNNNARKIQTRSPKPVCRMCVHWRQQDSHQWNCNARNKLNQNIWTEIIEKPANQNAVNRCLHGITGHAHAICRPIHYRSQTIWASDLEDYLPSRGFSPTKLYPSITYTTATPSNSDEFLVDRNKVLKKFDQMLHPIKYIKQEDPLPYIKDSLAYLQYNMLMTPAKRRRIMDTVPFCSLILSIIKIAMIDVNAMVICNNYWLMSKQK